MSYANQFAEAVRDACLSVPPRTMDDYAAMTVVLLHHAVLSYLAAKNVETGGDLSEAEMVALVTGTIEHIDGRIGALRGARN